MDQDIDKGYIKRQYAVWRFHDYPIGQQRGSGQPNPTAHSPETSTQLAVKRRTFSEARMLTSAMRSGDTMP